VRRGQAVFVLGLITRACQCQLARRERFVINLDVNRLVGLLVAISFLAALGTAHAQNATWNTNPGSSDWNTNTNWTPQIVPTGRASFDSSNTTSITFSNIAFVGTIQFNAGAPAYSFSIGSTITINIIGAGIVNNSSNTPAFTLSNLASLNFHFSSTPIHNKTRC
jgi:hypothetical protein